MNNGVRKELAQIKTHLSSVCSRLEELRDAEQDKYDNMPADLQNGVFGERINDVISYLSDAADNAQTTIDSLDNIE